MLLLISPYFIGSDYCYEKELARALERNEEGSCLVIPVILHPCDWRGLAFGHLRATPRDGRPISKHSNKHDAFVDVTRDIRTAAERLGKSGVESRVLAVPRREAAAAESSPPRSSNLRVKREFNDHARDQFLDDTFEYIANYFDNSLVELSKRAEWIDARFRRIDKDSFIATAYQNGDRRAACRIWRATGFAGDIAYSHDEAATSNSFNESMRATDDGYSLGLSPLGMSMHGRRDDEMLTPEGAAEYYWEVFVRGLQQ